MEQEVAGKNLIDQIVGIELDMFQTVNTSEHSPCQDQLHTFRLMRGMHYSVFGEEVLASLLEDLQQGREEGRNFMTEKYARMAGQIPPLSDSEEIGRIVEIEVDWQKEVSERFPHLFPEKDGGGFRNYLSCELETLSDATLAKLSASTVQAFKQGRNLIQERYDNLFKALGYDSIEDRERIEAEKA